MQRKNTITGTELSMDLQDSKDDEREMLQPGITVIELPELSDIPGQANIVPAPFGEMADVTSSSADEEGDDIFGEDGDEVIDENSDSNVSDAEKEDLDNAANDMPSGDDARLREAALDNADSDGTPLNEGSFKNDLSGTDLDVPGSEDDDTDEEIGEEDEENNDYSLGGDNHDDIAEDTF